MRAMLKTPKIFLGLITLSLMISLLSTTVDAAYKWTQRQEQAHEIAQIARILGLPETDPIIVRAQELWLEDCKAMINDPPHESFYNKDEAIMLAKIMYNESRGIKSDTEKASLAWVVLNRLDAGYGSTIKEVATAPYQFAYSPNTPIWDNLLDLSTDVLSRWEREKNGETNVGRVLPKDYFWYHGDGKHNYFRNSYRGGSYWNYSLSSPYKS